MAHNRCDKVRNRCKYCSCLIEVHAIEPNLTRRLIEYCRGCKCFCSPQSFFLIHLSRCSSAACHAGSRTARRERAISHRGSEVINRTDFFMLLAAGEELACCFPLSAVGLSGMCGVTSVSTSVKSHQRNALPSASHRRPLADASPQRISAESSPSFLAGSFVADLPLLLSCFDASVAQLRKSTGGSANGLIGAQSSAVAASIPAFLHSVEWLHTTSFSRHFFCLCSIASPGRVSYLSLVYIRELFRMRCE